MAKPNQNPTLGRCCHCEREGPSVRNILMLDVRSPEPGIGCWACLQCGLPPEGALAVLCDECLERGLKPKLACLGALPANRRIPIEQLTLPFEHDMSKHPEALTRAFRKNNAERS